MGKAKKFSESVLLLAQHAPSVSHHQPLHPSRFTIPIRTTHLAECVTLWLRLWPQTWRGRKGVNLRFSFSFCVHEKKISKKKKEKQRQRNDKVSHDFVPCSFIEFFSQIGSQPKSVGFKCDMLTSPFSAPCICMNFQWIAENLRQMCTKFGVPFWGTDFLFL